MSTQNNNIGEGFKMTEVGLIPEEWRVVKLRDDDDFHILTSGIQSFAGSKKYLSTSSIQGWRIESSECSITYNERPSRANMQPVLGSVWFAKMIGTKKVYSFTDENVQEASEYILSTGFCGILCRDRVDSRYLRFVFLSDFFNAAKDSLCSGATQRAINNENIGSIQVSLPPLPEQKAIAGVLATTQKAIETQDKTIAAARKLKKSLMRHLFTYGPVSVAEAEKVPLKDTEIGTVPEHREQKELGEISDITYGVQAAVANLTDSSRGIPILTNINIRNDGMLDTSTLRYYPLPENKRDRLILKKGDILFNWRSGSQYHVGKTAMFNLDGDYTFSSFILRFRANRDFVDNEYLFRYLYLLKDIGFFTSRRSQSSVNSVFNASLAAKIPVFLPSMSDQTGIAITLLSVDQKLRTEEKRGAALETLFRTMLHHLMTGKIRVKDSEATAA